MAQHASGHGPGDAQSATQLVRSACLACRTLGATFRTDVPHGPTRRYPGAFAFHVHGVVKDVGDSCSYPGSWPSKPVRAARRSVRRPHRLGGHGLPLRVEARQLRWSRAAVEPTGERGAHRRSGIEAHAAPATAQPEPADRARPGERQPVRVMSSSPARASAAGRRLSSVRRAAASRSIVLRCVRSARRLGRWPR